MKIYILQSPIRWGHLNRSIDHKSGLLPFKIIPQTKYKGSLPHLQLKLNTSTYWKTCIPLQILSINLTPLNIHLIFPNLLLQGSLSIFIMTPTIIHSSKMKTIFFVSSFLLKYLLIYTLRSSHILTKHIYVIENCIIH